jgi:hypothetical protein
VVTEAPAAAAAAAGAVDAAAHACGAEVVDENGNAERACSQTLGPPHLKLVLPPSETGQALPNVQVFGVNAPYATQKAYACAEPSYQLHSFGQWIPVWTLRGTHVLV